MLPNINDCLSQVMFHELARPIAHTMFADQAQKNIARSPLVFHPP
jgi:hypothetical protein